MTSGNLDLNTIEVLSQEAFSASQAMSRTFTAVIYREEDVYVAESPEVGTASQGETIEEALANLKEAIELYLEEFPISKTSPRTITTFSVNPSKNDESIENLIELVGKLKLEQNKLKHNYKHFALYFKNGELTQSNCDRN